MYRRSLVCDAAVDYPPIGVLSSDAAKDTVTTWRRPSPDAAFDMAGKDLTPLVTAGDNRLPTEMTQPPRGIPVHTTVVLNDAQHGSVPVAMGPMAAMIEDLLREAQRRGLTRGSRRAGGEEEEKAT
jgi:hypothetical protein